MTVGYTAYTANAVLNAVGNATSFSVATAYMKLHTGVPGAAGTTNAATETTRKAVSFGTGASSAMASDADIDWTSVAGSETYTYFSLWDASTGGNCLWTGTITAAAILAGNNFKIASGNATLSMTPAT